MENMAPSFVKPSAVFWKSKELGGRGGGCQKTGWTLGVPGSSKAKCKLCANSNHENRKKIGTALNEQNIVIACALFADGKSLRDLKETLGFRKVSN